jgi:hypothetical protein
MYCQILQAKIIETGAVNTVKMQKMFTQNTPPFCSDLGFQSGQTVLRALKLPLVSPLGSTQSRRLPLPLPCLSPARQAHCDVRVGCRRARLGRRCRTRRRYWFRPGASRALAGPRCPTPGTLTVTRERRPACFLCPDVHSCPSRTETRFPATFETGPAVSAAAPALATATACRCQLTRLAWALRLG